MKKSAMLKAGTAWADITPPVFTHMTGMGSNRPRPMGVHDRLKARALVLQSGDQKIALVSADINYIDYDSIDSIRKLVETYTDIRGCNVKVTSSHSHSAPGYYQLSPSTAANRREWQSVLDEERAHVRSACDHIAGAVYEANLNLEDAELAFGEGTSKYNIVRWHKTNDDQMLFIPFHRELPLNIPAIQDMFVMHVRRREDRKSLAFYYTNHAHAICVCLQSNLITADYPGCVASQIEKRFGGLCMFAPGAIGDQHPLDFDRGIEAAQRMGRQLAGQIVSAQKSMRYTSEVNIKTLETDVTLPKTGIQGEPLLPHTRTSVVVLNNVALSFWPGEPFGMILRQLRKDSPFARTVIVSNTDDFKYYFALENEYNRYKWEGTIALPTAYPVKTGNMLYGAALNLLRQADRKRTPRRSRR